MVTYNIKRVPCLIIIWQEGYLFNSLSQICQNQIYILDNLTIYVTTPTVPISSFRLTTESITFLHII